MGASIVVAVTAALLIGGVPAAAEEIPDGGLANDMVVLSPPDDPDRSQPDELNRGQMPGAPEAGFIVRSPQRWDRASYTVRLLSTGEGNVEDLRATVQQLADQIAQAGGTRLTVAAGTAPNIDDAAKAPAGEIYIGYDSTSPCTSAWAGCGGISYGSGWEIASGRAWIHPMVSSYSTGSRAHVVAHELGHALGLDHFDGTFEGSVQLMHSSSYAAGSYRSGDMNGLRYLASNVPMDPVSHIFRDASGWHKNDTGLRLRADAQISAINQGGAQPQAMVNENGKLFGIRADASGWYKGDTGIRVSPGSSISAITGSSWPSAMVNDGGVLYQVWGDAVAWYKGDTGIRFSPDAAISAMYMGNGWPQGMVNDGGTLFQLSYNDTGWHKGDTGIRVAPDATISAMVGYGWPHVMVNDGGALYSIWGDTSGWHKSDTGTRLSSRTTTISAVNMGGTSPQVFASDGWRLERIVGTSSGWTKNTNAERIDPGPMSAVDMGGPWPQILTSK